MPDINEIFTAAVRDLVGDGSAVVEHPCGQVFFVPGLWLGEVAEIRVTGFRKRLGFGELVRLVAASPHRLDAPCPHHGLGKHSCGGCPWQFVSYSAQLSAKELRVRQTLGRLGLEEAVRPIWGSARTLGYRNRAQFKSDGKVLGYVAAGSRQLVPVADCPILSDHNRHTLKELLATLPNNAWRPARKAQWTTLDIDEDIGASEVEPNRRRPFRQANSGQNERMKSWLDGAVQGLDKQLPVLELFAGSGNFTQVLAAAGFTRIVAVEGAAEVVSTLAQLPGVRATTGDLFSARAVDVLARECRDSGLLVLDPPRDGFSLLPALLAECRELKRVAYISCDLATFARDTRVLLDTGFHCSQVQPLDLFPHTPHVELLGLFTRC